MRLTEVQESLKGSWLVEVLRDLQACGNKLDLRIIFTHHPQLQATLQRDWEKEHINQDLVEEVIAAICHLEPKDVKYWTLPITDGLDLNSSMVSWYSRRQWDYTDTA